jgi:hypothetical protein
MDSLNLKLALQRVERLALVGLGPGVELRSSSSHAVFVTQRLVELVRTAHK